MVEQNNRVTWRDIYKISSEMNAKLDDIKKELYNLKAKVFGIAATVAILTTVIIHIAKLLIK